MVAAMLAAVTAAVPAPRLVTAAANAGDAAGELLAATNAARAAAGLRALTPASDLMGLAASHAAAEAAAHQIFHDPALESHVCCWSSIGENDGVGPSASVIEAALMASAPHRANILGGFTQVGIGAVVGSDGQLYIDEIFRTPMSAPPPPPPTHRPPPPTHRPVRPVTTTPPSAGRPAPAPGAGRDTAASRDFVRPPLRPPTGLTLATMLQRLRQRPAHDPLASSIAWWSALTTR